MMQSSQMISRSTKPFCAESFTICMINYSRVGICTLKWNGNTTAFFLLQKLMYIFFWWKQWKINVSTKFSTTHEFNNIWGQISEKLSNNLEDCCIREWLFYVFLSIFRVIMTSTTSAKTSGRAQLHLQKCWMRSFEAKADHHNWEQGWLQWFWKWHICYFERFTKFCLSLSISVDENSAKTC